MEFSVIVPAYNAGSFLDTCIASVEAQSVTDWELIIINDGSVDNSADILKAYAGVDSRIRVFEQENMGQFFARQKGIGMAKGDYIVFLDSDDELAPDCLSVLHKVIRKKTWDIILYAGKIVLDGSETGRTIGFISSDQKEVPVEWVRRSLIASNDLNSLCIKAFRREMFDGDNTDYSGFRGTHCGEDKVQLLYPVTKAKNILYLPACLYCYNYRTESTMHRFEMDDISRMLAGQMFSMLQLYMQKWNMDDPKNQELVMTYRIKMLLSVYFGFRKRCTTVRERRDFGNYPWHKYIDKSTVYYRQVKKKLSIKDRIKLFVAEKRL